MPLPSSHSYQHTETDRISYVALSLAPFSWRRRMAERLHAGDPPGRILDSLSAERTTQHAIDRGTLEARAGAALARAGRAGIVLVAWGDPVYPAALSAIADPPPAL